MLDVLNNTIAWMAGKNPVARAHPEAGWRLVGSNNDLIVSQAQQPIIALLAALASGKFIIAEITGDSPADAVDSERQEKVASLEFLESVLATVGPEMKFAPRKALEAEIQRRAADLEE